MRSFFFLFLCLTFSLFVGFILDFLFLWFYSCVSSFCFGFILYIFSYLLVSSLAFFHSLFFILVLSFSSFCHCPFFPFSFLQPRPSFLLFPLSLSFSLSVGFVLVLFFPFSFIYSCPSSSLLVLSSAFFLCRKKTKCNSRIVKFSLASCLLFNVCLPVHR